MRGKSNITMSSICHICQKEINEFHYARSYPMLITKAQVMRGVVPGGDMLIRICSECKEKSEVYFHNPEFS